LSVCLFLESVNNVANVIDVDRIGKKT